MPSLQHGGQIRDIDRQFAADVGQGSLHSMCQARSILLSKRRLPASMPCTRHTPQVYIAYSLRRPRLTTLCGISGEGGSYPLSSRGPTVPKDDRALLRPKTGPVGLFHQHPAVASLHARACCGEACS